MKKIAFVLGGMSRGGAERVISILSRSYAERGYETEIVVLLSNEVGYKLHPTTRLIDLTGNTTSRLKRLPYWLRSIRKYVKESKPDVIVSFVARINLLVINAVRGLNTKLIISERNDPRYDGRSKPVDMLTKMQYNRADKVVFQTERAKEYFPKLTNGTIIPNPISVPCYATAPSGKKVVTMGRLMPQKNQKMLVEAFSSVIKEHPDAVLEIYGAGELEDELSSQIASLGLTENVRLKGNAFDVHERIADASIFALSSDYEGLSNALLEAMTMGLPCVSTNCAGADEYITDGKDGFIVNVGDSAAMASAITKLLSDEALRASFAKEAKEKSKRFSTEAVMSLWDEVIFG